MDNSQEKKHTNLGDFLIVILLILVLLFSIFRIERAQVKLKDYLEQKRDDLKAILSKIEETKLQKARFILYKKWSRIGIRYVLVFALMLLNMQYLKHFTTGNERTLANCLGLITDLNAILLLMFSLIVFLLQGSFFELKNAVDTTQNFILKILFHKKEQTIETILTSNIESEASIRQEIMKTEVAIIENDRLTNTLFPETSLINLR